MTFIILLVCITQYNPVTFIILLVCITQYNPVTFIILLVCIPRPSQMCGLTLINSLEGLAELYLATVQALAVSYLLRGIASLPDCSF